MKLWLLKNLKPTWGTMTVIVVREVSEKKARIMAATKAYGEGEKVWLDGKKSSCVVLEGKGKAGVILEKSAD